MTAELENLRSEVPTRAQPGRLIAVVGPSGAGKDSIIAGLLSRRPDLRCARRTITRPADCHGEDHEELDAPAFAVRASRGAFLLSWRAHGLHYGLPASVRDRLDEGHDVLANLSRRILDDAALRVARMEILHVTAAPETLARRLYDRSRETAAEIASRLARNGASFPDALVVHEVSNDGSLHEAVVAAEAALYPSS